MPTPTLFMLNIPETDGSKKARKAVLFPVSVKGSQVILATCSHTIKGIIGPYEMIICDSSGHVLPRLENLTRTLILPPELGTDLAFVEMHMDKIPAPVRLSDQSTISRSSTLSHARNVMYRSDYPGQTCVITVQTV